MTLPASIRVNAQLPFPSLIKGLAPITIGKAGGIWNVGLNADALGAVSPAPADYATNFAFVWNSVTQTWTKVSLTTLSELVGTPNFWSSQYAGATSTASTTGIMKGIGHTAQITIAKSGCVLVMAAGMAINSAVADGVKITGLYGTGTPPSPGDAPSGTQYGAVQHFVASTAAGQQGWTIIDLLGLGTPLVLGTTYWFDIAVAALTGGTATVNDTQLVVLEL